MEEDQKKFSGVEGGQENVELKEKGVDVNVIDHNCGRIPLEYSASSIQRNLIALLDYPEAQRNFPVSASLGFIHKGSFLVYHISGVNHNLSNYSHTQSIHLTELIRMTTSSTLLANNNKISKGTVILQAKWLETLNGTILLLASIHGIYFFNDEGKHIGKFDNCFGLNGYSRACSSLGNTIVAGTDSGDILCFEYDPTTANVPYTHRKEKLHLSSIQDMSKYQQMFASGDASGVIKVWKLDNSEGSTLTCPPSISVVGDFLAAEDCVTGCILSGNFVVGCYASGVVRIYDIKSKERQVLIKAHSRWIVSMDMNRNHTLLLTVSEDNTARIFKIREKVNDKPINMDEISAQPKMVHSVTVKNQVLVGGVFVETHGRVFALTSYAEKQLLIFSTPIIF